MKYAVGVLYPHDGGGREIRFAHIVDLTGFDIRQYREKMIGMSIYRYLDKRDHVGKALDVYLDEQDNLCMLFQFTFIEESVTHLQLCYALQIDDQQKLMDVKMFHCCLSNEDEAFFEACSFKIVDLVGYKQRYFKNNLLLTP